MAIGTVFVSQQSHPASLTHSNTSTLDIAMCSFSAVLVFEQRKPLLDYRCLINCRFKVSSHSSMMLMSLQIFLNANCVFLSLTNAQVKCLTISLPGGDQRCQSFVYSSRDSFCIYMEIYFHPITQVTAYYTYFCTFFFLP